MAIASAAVTADAVGGARDSRSARGAPDLRGGLGLCAYLRVEIRLDALGALSELRALPVLHEASCVAEGRRRRAGADGRGRAARVLQRVAPGAALALDPGDTYPGASCATASRL